MYNALVNWIGSKTCTVAGNIGEVLNAGQVCANGQALNMGLVVVALLAFSIAVMTINARRRQLRDNNYYR